MQGSSALPIRDQPLHQTWVSSQQVHNCERGIIFPRGTPLVQTDCLSTNIEAAGSGNDPAWEENLGLTCGTTSKHCAYARKVSEIGWVSPLGGATCRMSCNCATQWPAQAQVLGYTLSIKICKIPLTC